MPLTEDTEKAEFTGHTDTWQNPQDKEKSNKDNCAEISSSWIKGNPGRADRDHRPKRRERLSIWTN